MTGITKEKALSRAKIALLGKKDAAFVSTIVVSLNNQWTDTIPTAGTNGVDLLVNEEFFMGLNPLEQVGLLAHEAWHVALQHVMPDRVRGRNFKVYNEAADHVINLMLLDSGFRLPKGGLANPDFKGMSTEQVYDALMKDPSKQDPNFQPDVVPGPPSNDPAAQQAHQDAVTSTILRAATQAKLSGDPSAGAIAGEIMVAMNETLYPKLPWQVLLMDFFNGLAKEDYTFTRPNRRFMPQMYLPALFSEGMGTLACAVDTSGSVSDEDFNAFRTEMNYIKELLSPESMHIVDFDTKVNTVHILTDMDSVEQVEFKGRGGTSLLPVFEHFAEHKPEVLVVFSDLECDAIEQDPGYPVLWVRTPGSGHTPSFGTLIEFDPHN